MIRVRRLGPTLATGLGLYAAWLAGVLALPHVAAPAKVGLAAYPVLAPIITASILQVVPEDTETEIEIEDELEED